MDLELMDLEIKFITNLPAGSSGVLTTVPQNKPLPLNKKDVENIIRKLRNG